MKRLFVGVPLSLEIKEAIKPLFEQLKETKADFNFVSLENLHFTLKFLGDVSEEKIPEIVEKLNEILSKQEKFEIRLKEVGAFPSLEKINVIWIGTESLELLNLMKKMNEKLNYIRKDEHAEEVPHLTIARVKSGKNKEKLKELLQKVKNNSFGELVVSKVILYESELTPEGPVYKELSVFELR